MKTTYRLQGHLCHAGCRLRVVPHFFSRGVIFTRARVSLALLSLRKNGGLLVVYAGCHARYIRNTFLFAPSTTSLLVTTMGASIYHNYIFSCFFVRLFVLFSLVVVLFSLDKSKKCRKVLENFWKHPSCVIISLSELPAVLAIENYFLIYRFSQG